jgi:hypothetical protein
VSHTMCLEHECPFTANPDRSLSLRSFPADIMDKMHTLPFLGQIDLESPVPSVLGARSIPAVTLETAAQARALLPRLRVSSGTSPRRSGLGVIVGHR